MTYLLELIFTKTNTKGFSYSVKNIDIFFTKLLQDINNKDNVRLDL